MSQKKPSSEKSQTKFKSPISQRCLARILVIVIVLLAFVAAYYQSAYQLEIKRYKKLEDKYVRVRDILGREETQRLIDQSHQQENN